MSDTKERPIIFSAPMIRAILENRKTQTRRVVKQDPRFLNYAPRQVTMNGEWHPTSPSGKIGLTHPIPCPYGKPGDLLWVRETWAAEDVGSNLSLVGIQY